MRPTVLLFLFLFLITFFPQGSEGQNRAEKDGAKDTLRNAIGAELLGRGQVYSISYRRKFGIPLDHWVSFNASYYGGPEISLVPSYSFIPWGKGIFKLKVGLSNPHYFAFWKSPGDPVNPRAQATPFYQWALVGELGGHFAISRRITIELNGLIVLYYDTPLVDSYEGWLSRGDIWGGLQLNYRF